MTMMTILQKNNLLFSKLLQTNLRVRYHQLKSHLWHWKLLVVVLQPKKHKLLKSQPLSSRLRNLICFQMKILIMMTITQTTICFRKKTKKIWKNLRILQPSINRNLSNFNLYQSKIKNLKLKQLSNLFQRVLKSLNL